MKRHMWAAAAALPLLLAAPAIAGDYHNGLTLRCAQCHIMHYSQAHGYNADGTGFFGTLGPGGPFEHLLRDSVNNLCLSCHDNNGFAPDVLGAANTGNEPSSVRTAGFLNRLGVEGQPASGHTLDSTETAPGSDPPWSNSEGLNCADCHHQHGYAGFGHPTGSQYRNLTSSPGNGSSAFVTYNNTSHGTNDLTRDVFENMSDAYDISQVDFNEPDPTLSAIANWCGGCHTNFHGTVGSTEIGGTTSEGGFLRHPVQGVDIGGIGGGHSSLTQFQSHANRVKVMSETGDWLNGSDVTPTCISCHKAHGNGNAFGLIYMKGTGTVTENGDDGTQLEHLCGQCHVQASEFTI
jgi:hypothetical protein